MSKLYREDLDSLNMQVFENFMKWYQDFDKVTEYSSHGIVKHYSKNYEVILERVYETVRPKYAQAETLRFMMALFLQEFNGLIRNNGDQELDSEVVKMFERIYNKSLSGDIVEMIEYFIIERGYDKHYINMILTLYPNFDFQKYGYEIVKDSEGNCVYSISHDEKNEEEVNEAGENINLFEFEELVRSTLELQHLKERIGVVSEETLREFLLVIDRDFTSKVSSEIAIQYAFKYFLIRYYNLITSKEDSEFYSDLYGDIYSDGLQDLDRASIVRFILNDLRESKSLNVGMCNMLLSIDPNVDFDNHSIKVRLNNNGDVTKARFLTSREMAVRNEALYEKMMGRGS